MKKMHYYFFIVIALFMAGFKSLSLSSYTTLPLLSHEEQQQYKAGKQFFEWQSPYGNLSMHYIERGEGPHHLILLHGFRANTFTWRYLIEPLAQAGYHVWALDLLGYGFSDKPIHVPYDVDFYVEEVIAFMKDKNISSAHLAGNSMGGGLALNLALGHPEKVCSLTLISALGYPFDLPLYLSFSSYLGPLWTPFLGPGVIRMGMKQLVFDPHSVTEEQIHAYSLPYRFPGGAEATLLTLKQFDKQRLLRISQQYALLTFPMLIIWGDHDTVLPLKHYEQFTKDFPSADCLLIPNCGHLPQEEKPELVINTVLQFLQPLKN